MQRMTLVLAQMLNENNSNSNNVPAENAATAAHRTDTNGHVNPSSGLDNSAAEGGNQNEEVAAASSGRPSPSSSGMPQLEDDLASLRSSFVSR
jgi:hypothetical protein